MNTEKTKMDIQRRKKVKSVLVPIAFIGPHFVLFSVFVLLPIILGLIISFTKWDYIHTPTWTGLENYRTILFDKGGTYNRQFFDGIKNTFLFVLFNVPVSILLPLIFAIMLNLRFRGSKLFRAALYLPTLFSITSIGIIWTQLLNKRFGIVGPLDMKISLTTTLPYAWITLIAISVWWTMGGNMVIYQAALAGIPSELYESARLDGAGFLREIWYISLPSIKFQLLFTTVTTIAGSFNVYGQPAMLTQDGYGGTPKIWVTTMYIRQLAFGSGQSIAGIASAMAIMLGAVILIFSFAQFRLISNDN